MFGMYMISNACIYGVYVLMTPDICPLFGVKTKRKKKHSFHFSIVFVFKLTVRIPRMNGTARIMFTPATKLN